MATVAVGQVRLATSSSASGPAASSAAASHTLGVPTAARTVALGVGTSTVASSTAGNARMG